MTAIHHFRPGDRVKVHNWVYVGTQIKTMFEGFATVQSLEPPPDRYLVVFDHLPHQTFVRYVDPERQHSLGRPA